VRLLIVDDDALMLEILKVETLHAGHEEVVLAQSAAEAAKAIANANVPFDCVLVDFQMPEIDGGYFCSWLRSLPDYASSPIIMITGLVDKPSIERAFTAGASDYITKPVDFSDLKSRLRQLTRELSLKRSQQVNELDQTRVLINKEATKVEFSEPVKIGGIKYEVELTALENYVVQLSLNGLHELSAFSVAIKDARRFHSLCPRDGFSDLLSAVGATISKCSMPPYTFISYAGYGVFVGVMERGDSTSDDRNKWEKSINHFFKSEFECNNDAFSQVELAMAIPRRFSTWAGEKSVDLLYNVMGDAEDRSMK